MSLTVNLRHLQKRSLQLQGELTPAELDFAVHDELIRASQPLHYDLEIELLDDSLLVQGSLQIALDCQCARCLKDFLFELALDSWTLHLPLAGEDAAPIHNDCVDLTPHLREDILIEFPQHPLCKPDCGGLGRSHLASQARSDGKDGPKLSGLAELKKLKL